MTACLCPPAAGTGGSSSPPGLAEPVPTLRALPFVSASM